MWTFPISAMKSFLSSYLRIVPILSMEDHKETEQYFFETRPREQKHITNLIMCESRDQLALNIFKNLVFSSCTMESSHFFKQFGVYFLAFTTLTFIITNMPFSTLLASFLLSTWAFQNAGNTGRFTVKLM